MTYVDNRTWEECVEKAEHYLATGMGDIYLSREPSVGIWPYVVGVKTGGTHRLEMATSVNFIAEHPSGLHFRWSFDLEPPSANGKGHYEIDVPNIQRVVQYLPDKPRATFLALLVEDAEQLEASGRKLMALAQAEFGAAMSLRNLTGIEVQG